MEPKYFTLKEVSLNNNCPECYSREGLQLTFKQKFVESVLYKAISKDTTAALYCNVCENEIFPERWTDDIDRVFDYQKRAATPKPTSFKLKPLAWVLILFNVLIVGGILFFVFKD